MPPSEPTQHGMLRGGWVLGAAGAQNSCKGKSDETRNRRFRIMVFKLLLWSPDGLSQAPRGSLEPAISCLASITQADRDWDIQSHKMNSNDTCDHQTRNSRNQTDDLQGRMKGRTKSYSLHSRQDFSVF